MKVGIIYLNKKRTRWLVYEDGKKAPVPFVTASGQPISRVPMYYESFGDQTIVGIRYKGKTLEAFPNSVLDD